ncbi:hypothetical protein FISHEDRAFT_57945 [Fistulina hepatica ATCC 64428]|uniref:Uncharacterized protein n=1 Tax=Fistulina hepatica ATCC 64428 TaxID=1128425 RepID=A0A0D7AEB2_9AGAR|nr:hypothetical protein FISHEDRAFT_57945 [Fistulina hepatica ATCC 64428]
MSIRAVQRRRRLLEIETEQRMEEMEALKMTAEQLQVLMTSFQGVAFEFTDLDGMTWSHSDLRQRRHPAPVESPTSTFAVLTNAHLESFSPDDTIRVSIVKCAHADSDPVVVEHPENLKRKTFRPRMHNRTRSSSQIQSSSSSPSVFTQAPPTPSASSMPSYDAPPVPPMSPHDISSVPITPTPHTTKRTFSPSSTIRQLCPPRSFTRLLSSQQQGSPGTPAYDSFNSAFTNSTPGGPQPVTSRARTRSPVKGLFDASGSHTLDTLIIPGHDPQSVGTVRGRRKPPGLSNPPSDVCTSDACEPPPTPTIPSLYAFPTSPEMPVTKPQLREWRLETDPFASHTIDDEFKDDLDTPIAPRVHSMWPSVYTQTATIGTVKRKRSRQGTNGL